MTRDHRDMDAPLPAEIRRQLADLPDPPPSTLRQYEYLKQDFFAAFDPPAAATETSVNASPAPSLADVVLSLTGKLVRWADDVRAALIGDEPAPAMVIARGATAEADNARCLCRAVKAIPGAKLQASTYQVGDTIELEINLLGPDDHEIRPFEVSVCDQDGQDLADPLYVGPTDQARFPGPRAGTYVFCIRWAGGEEQLVLDVVD